MHIDHRPGKQATQEVGQWDFSELAYDLIPASFLASYSCVISGYSKLMVR